MCDCVVHVEASSASVHMLFCARGRMCERGDGTTDQDATHLGLYAFGVDASQNTDVSSEMSNQTSWDIRERGRSQGERKNLIGQWGGRAVENDHDASLRFDWTMRLLCSSTRLSITHRQTRGAVVGDVILIVSLPRIPWGRTPDAVALLLGLLKRKTGRKKGTEEKVQK